MSISLDKPRRFAHVDGFDDSTKYIEITPNGESFIKTNARYFFNGAYTLKECLGNVGRGIWKELP